MSVAPLHLDLHRNAASGWRAVGWGALAAALAASLALGQTYGEVTQRHAASQSRRDRLSERAQAKAPRSAASSDPRTLIEVQRANLIIDQLTVPWDDLFGAVEAANARGVAVLSLTPNARERSLRLTGESRSMGDLLSYVGRLADQPALSQVHLQGYNTVLREGVSVVAFTLAATWRQQPP
ncbi:MAG TPA: hypothetical protein VE029_12320 [Rhizobacter sp.]|nr:hypothetical protein [Rhizobacter sp.]